MKRSIYLALTFILLAVSLTACGEEQPQQVSVVDVKAVDVSTAVYSSYLYVITDESAVTELVDLYNGIRYQPLAEGEDPGILSDDPLYSLRFSASYDNGVMGETVAGCSISPKGFVMFRDGVTYRLTSDFDEERLKTLIGKYNIMPDVATVE